MTERRRLRCYTVLDLAQALEPCARPTVVLQTCLKGLGFPAKKCHVLELLQRYGKSREDTIEFAVFEAILTEKYRGRSFSELVDKAFLIFDPDQTGAISHRSLKAIVKQVGENISDEELQDMITMFDVNGDGCIDKEEFRSIFKVYDPHSSCDDDF